MFHFIVNPSSRSNTGRRIWKQVEKELKMLHIKYKVHYTSYQYHATKLATEICKEDGEKTIVALGGDGTVNEVINGISDFDNVKFGYIPTGSSNDFARGLGMPTKTKKALDNILYPKNVKEMNVGIIKLQEEVNKFGVSCGIGLDAFISAKANSSPLKPVFNRLHLGFLTYAFVCVQEVFKYRPFKLTVSFDDQKPQIFDYCLFCTAMNGLCEGGGLRLSPGANPFDDYLDVCIVNSNNLVKLICVLPLAFFGKHTICTKEVSVVRCKKLHVISDRPMPIHRDGEACTSVTDLTISLEPKKLKVIC